MFRKWAHGLVIGLLLGSLFVAFPQAQNYIWSSINGAPYAPKMTVGPGSRYDLSLNIGEPLTGFYLFSVGIPELVAGNVRTAAWWSGSQYLLQNNSGLFFGESSDTVIAREGTAILQMGVDVTVTPIDQQLKACDGITGTDIPGCDQTIAGGRGTGSGYPGAVFIQNAGILGTGTTAQTLATYAAFHGKLQVFGTQTDSHNVYHFEESINFDAVSQANSAGYINIYSVPANPYTMGTGFFRSLNIGNGKGSVIAYFDGTNGAFTVGSASGTGAGSLYAGAYYAGTTAGVDCTNALQVDTVKGIVTSCSNPTPDPLTQDEINQLRGLLSKQ